jgi:hypothetical protein
VSTHVNRMGHNWSAHKLYNAEGWGQDATDEDAKILGDAVKAKFHELTPRGVAWIPQTNELLVDEGTEEFDAEALLEQAYAYVWDHIGEYV